MKNFNAAMHRTKEIRMGKIATSQTEIKDIIKAWIAVSLAFGIVQTVSPGNFLSIFLSKAFYLNFVVSGLTVGIGFLLHELGHKIVAQRYGCFAEFRSFDNMLVFAVLMSFFGFVFAAPGAVMISGRVNPRKNGIISAAGPLVNLALAVVFLPLAFAPSAFLKILGTYGFMINSWLALFNMIPLWLFDGRKVWNWSKSAYFTIVVIAVFFMYLQRFVH